MNEGDRDIDRDRNGQDHQPKRNPMIDFSDAVNRSMVGDPGVLAKGSCLTKILNLVLIILLLLGIAQCSK